jgi:voltage-gated potassium channel
LGSTVALVAIYYLLPLDNTSIGVVVGMLAIGLLALVALITFQVRSIIKAAYPALRAVGALATSVPLFCCCLPPRTSSWAGSLCAISASP